MKNYIKVISILFLAQFSFANVVFQKEGGGQRLIVYADADGKNQKVISDKNMDTYHPDISSSGNYVAFSQGHIKQGGNTQLQIIIKDLAKNLTEVWSDFQNQNIHVEFSGNERFLAFSSPNPKTNKQNIFVIDLWKERSKGPTNIESVSGETIHKYSPQYNVLDSTYDCYAPAVSSDGSLIVYHRTQDKTNKSAAKQLVGINTHTNVEFEITDSNKHAMFPSISADDRYLAYVSKDSGQWDIFVHDLWTQSKRQITDDLEMEYTPAFRDNNEIYFTRFSDDKNYGQLIDIHYVNSKWMTSKKLASTSVFLNDKDFAEYVPSFSNSNKLYKDVLPSFPAPERSSFGKAIYNDKVYIAGGHQGPGHQYPENSFLNILQVYDLKTKVWKDLSPMPSSKHGFEMASYNNYLYVFGGFTFSDEHLPKWKSLSTIERYDIKNNSWKTLEVKLPESRSSNALAVVDDKVYIFGGWDSTPKFANDKEGKFSSNIDVFDLKTESISTLNVKLPEPLRRAFTAVTLGDDIYLLGGIGEGASHFEWLDNVTVFNPKLQTWTEKAPLPFPTFAPGAGVIGEDIYMMGGMAMFESTNYDLNYVDDIYKYSALNNEWQHSGIYLNENKGFPQVVSINSSELGILGGHSYVQTVRGTEDSPVSTFELIGFD